MRAARRTSLAAASLRPLRTRTEWYPDLPFLLPSVRLMAVCGCVGSRIVRAAGAGARSNTSQAGRRLHRVALHLQAHFSGLRAVRHQTGQVNPTHSCFITFIIFVSLFRCTLVTTIQVAFAYHKVVFFP